ncbi:MAG: hypothetical protein ABI655_04215 [Phenylobacterium sp.]
MAALSESKVEIVRALVTAAPDKVVAALQAALEGTGDDSPLAVVRRLVTAETADRELRNVILQPIAPMCVGDGRAPHMLVFPARVLPCLWRGLKLIAPDELKEAALELYDFRPGESSTEPFDRPLRMLIEGMRIGEPEPFAEAAQLCEQARPGASAQLLRCLELGPVARRAIIRLPEWTAHFLKDEIVAAARIVYRDAVAIADDAGPCFFDMLAAQLPHPWMVLRIISAVMDKPNERYLADSELGSFGERVMSGIDETIAAIIRIDVEGGPPVALAMAKRVELITLQTAELEKTIELDREHGWGHRIVKQKLALASAVEGRMREADRFVGLSLPTLPEQVKRAHRNVPRLTLPPDPKAMKRAITLLSFARDVRSSADFGGFAAIRTKLLEKTGEMLGRYLDELVDLMKTADAEEMENARAFLKVVAQFAAIVLVDKDADQMRRRLALITQGAQRADAA